MKIIGGGIFPKIVSLAVAVGLSGCADVTRVDGTLTSQNERRTVKQAQAAYSVGGAVLGAGGGFLVAKLTGQNNTNTALLTAAGATAGATAGHRVGTEKGVKAVREKRYVKLEKTRLNELISHARSYNHQVATYNEKLRVTISGLKKERAADRSVSSAVAKRATAEKNYAEDRLKDVNSTIKMREELIPQIDPSQRSGYRTEQSNLESERAKLKASIGRLSSLEERASAG